MFSYNFIIWYIMEHFWQLVEQEEAVCGYEVYIEAPIYLCTYSNGHSPLNHPCLEYS